MFFKITQKEIKLCSALCFIILIPFIMMGLVGICGSSGLIFLGPFLFGMPWSKLVGPSLEEFLSYFPSLHSAVNGKCAGPLDSIALTLPCLINFIIIFYLILVHRNIFNLIKSKVSNENKKREKGKVIFFLAVAYLMIGGILYLFMFSSNRVSKILDTQPKYKNKTYSNKYALEYAEDLSQFKSHNNNKIFSYFYEKKKIDSFDFNYKKCSINSIKKLKCKKTLHIQPKSRFLVIGYFTHHHSSILSFSSLFISSEPYEYLLIQNIASKDRFEIASVKFQSMFKDELLIKKRN